MPLDPKRVQAVFGAVIECDDAADRAAILDRECSTDAELRRRVEALLRANDQSYRLLDQPIVRGARQVLAPHMGPEEIDLGLTEVGSFVVGSEVSGPTIDLRPDSDADWSVAAESESPNRVVPAISGYEILEELGRGGMGEVYKARKFLLNRPCALKMILGGSHASAEAAARFLAEAQAIARLHHPHIVQIHHIGESDGLPYFELEYVDGGGLDKSLDGTPWTARRAAGLVQHLASAIDEAHRLGIVHRDLKPGNILLMADGTPKITDFGLAKSLGDDSGLTATDSIMGSPSYMAPEQAAGQTRHLGTPADIYALGATLYELLTGRPPFRGATVLETLEQVKNVEPVAPSRLIPGLPRDVETIALKCLQKEPGKRYDSAAALAEDLRRFLEDEPIVARPVPVWERAWRWARRHPAPAALTAVIVLVTVLGLTGILWQWSEAVQARDLAYRRAIAEAEARRETETTLVDMYTTSGITAGEQGEPGRAALWFAGASRRASTDPTRRLANAVRARTWGREAFAPLHALVVDRLLPGSPIFHPSGRYLMTKSVVNSSTRDFRNTLWDLETEQSLPFPGGLTSVPVASWSLDGTTLAAAGPEGDLVLARFPDGAETTRIRFPATVRHLAFSPDGRYLAIAGGNLARVWDVTSQAFATPELLHPSVVTALMFHPRGRSLATGCQDDLARLYAVPGDSGKPLWPPVPHSRPAGVPEYYPVFSSPPRFVEDGQGLVTYDSKKVFRVRDVATGVVLRRVDSPGLSGRSPTQDAQNPTSFAAIEVSPDGRYLACVGYQSPRVRLFEARTGQPVGPVLDHQNTVFSVTFSPDSRMLATGSTDNNVRLWAVPGGGPLARPLDLHRTVKSVAFAPDGRSLVTQDGDLLRLWALPGTAVPVSRVSVDGGESVPVVSPDGALMIATGMTYAPSSGVQSTRPLRVSTGEPVGPALRPGGKILDATFSPDGRSVAVVNARHGESAEGQDVQVWDWASGRREWRGELPSEPRSLAYRPDGRRLAVLCGGGELVVFDALTGRETNRWQAHDAEPAHHWVNNGKIAFSPDGQSVLSWGMGNDVRVWTADEGRPRYEPIRHGDKCHDLQFSPDGRSMVLASYDGSVRVRDVATGSVVVELPAHPDKMYSAAFSPDGRLLVTACRDQTVRVWDWRGGRLVCPPFEQAREALTATFTPDGRWVLTTSIDGTARAWDWRTGKAVTPPLRIGGELLSIVATRDGRHAVVGGGHGMLAVLDLGGLAAAAGAPDLLCLSAELAVGQRLHEGGGTVNLSADEWIERWRRFRRQSTPDAAERPLVVGDRPGDGRRAIDLSARSPVMVDAIRHGAQFDEAANLLSLGRVDEARAIGRELVILLRRVVEASPDEPSEWHRLALALALAGDIEESRRASAATLERFSRDESRGIGDAARVCLIVPNAVDDLSAPRRLAEAAVARDPNPAWLHYVLGLARYREGQSERAIEDLSKSLKLGADWSAVALNYPVLAMAHHRLGHADEARKWLERAHVVVPGETIMPNAIWWDRLEFVLLRREAHALILDAAFPDEPFAH